jgi:hypothetical protein
MLSLELIKFLGNLLVIFYYLLSFYLFLVIRYDVSTPLSVLICVWYVLDHLRIEHNHVIDEEGEIEHFFRFIVF